MSVFSGISFPSLIQFRPVAVEMESSSQTSLSDKYLDESGTEKVLSSIGLTASEGISHIPLILVHPAILFVSQSF